jgi:hypothetical protein
MPSVVLLGGKDCVVHARPVAAGCPLESVSARAEYLDGTAANLDGRRVAAPLHNVAIAEVVEPTSVAPGHATRPFCACPTRSAFRFFTAAVIAAVSTTRPAFT